MNYCLVVSIAVVTFLVVVIVFVETRPQHALSVPTCWHVWTTLINKMCVYCILMFLHL